jgi:hypothetical protein
MNLMPAFLKALTSCGALSLWAASCAAAQPFSVADEIGIAQFQDYNGSGAQFVQFSPDGEYLAAYTERGRVDVNQVEGSLRIYRSSDLRNFLRSPPATLPPLPWWTIEREKLESPAIGAWSWLADSSGVAFIESGPASSNRLMVASVERKTIAPLSPDEESVLDFNVHDVRNYVYVLGAAGVTTATKRVSGGPATTLTGHYLVDILFPEDLYPERAQRKSLDRSTVWAVVNGQKRQLTNKEGTPLKLPRGLLGSTLSPDGRSLVTAVPVANVPIEWESRFPPPYPGSSARVRAGQQESQSIPAEEFVRINLATNEIESLTDAPISFWLGGGGAPQWSKDGEAILLPQTFWNAHVPGPVPPCGALYWDVGTKRSTCIEALRPETGESDYPEGFRFIEDLRFAEGDKHRVVLSFSTPRGKRGAWEYRQQSGRWTLISQAADTQRPLMSAHLKAKVTQYFNEPPLLIVSDPRGHRSRVLWDPNPQLKDIALGEATVYSWKDAAAREWRGGLFKPVGFKVGQRYPIVIQNHGFAENEFRPSGVFPTAFAAYALAGAGILVLQVDDAVCSMGNREESFCSVGGFEAAARQLVADGLADPARIGIIGFSRTCYYVLQMLTTSALDIRAASITDGVMGDYFQYLMSVTDTPNPINDEFESLIGAQPFGPGLATWLERSPLFNIDKVHAPVLIVGEGEASLLSMWGPYAALHRLKKPTELVLLNTDEHVLSNPAMRLASQGGSVDWFRFWLQDYEDPDRTKAEQYARWRELRKLQSAQDAERANAGKGQTVAH